jgi:hypothetical protein
MKNKIAIKFAGGFKSLEAEIVEIQGIRLGIHKTPGKSGWSVTEPGTGLALASKAKSRQAAVDSVREQIRNAGVDKALALLAKQPAAPAVDTLEAYVEPAKVDAAKADVAEIVGLVADKVGGLTDRQRAAVARALNSRTGQLKAKSPSAFGDADEQLAAAAWQGIQPNGYKLGIVTVFSLRGEARELYDKLVAVKWPAAFDKDKLALVKAGVW